MELKSGQQRIRFIANVRPRERFIAVTERKHILQRHRSELTREEGGNLKILGLLFYSDLMNISGMGCIFIVLK